MNIENNTILITGGSRGIGFEMARQLAGKNNKVIITGRDEQQLHKSAEQLENVSAIQSDVGNAEDIEKLYQQIVKDFPELNMIINNAGVMETINLQNNNLSSAELANEIDINLKGPIILNNVFLPLLIQKNKAAIVNVSSGLAFVPQPIVPIYCATKAAIHSYTLSLRVQLNNTRIKVFELAPPLTQTDMIGAFSDEDIKGVPITQVEEMVTDFIKALAKDTWEIRIGVANQLKFMSRFFPNFILKQLSKSVDKMQAG